MHNPVSVLRDAADIMELRGQTTGKFVDRHTGKVCAAGALRLAFGGIELLHPVEYVVLPDSVFNNEYRKLVLWLDAHVERETGGRFKQLFIWNDCCASKEDVVAFFHSCADELEKQQAMVDAQEKVGVLV